MKYLGDCRWLGFSCQTYTNTYKPSNTKIENSNHMRFYGPFQVAFFPKEVELLHSFLFESQLFLETQMKEREDGSRRKEKKQVESSR